MSIPTIKIYTQQSEIDVLVKSFQGPTGPQGNGLTDEQIQAAVDATEQAQESASKADAAREGIEGELGSLKDTNAKLFVPSSNLLNLNDADFTENAYMATEGYINSSATNDLSGYIPVTPGLTYSMGDDNAGYARFLTAFTAEKIAVPSAGSTYVGQAHNPNWTCPEGVAYIRVSFRKSETFRVNESDSLLPFELYGDRIDNDLINVEDLAMLLKDKDNQSASATADNLAAGETLELVGCECSVKKNTKKIFVADIGAFSSIEIGLKKSSNKVNHAYFVVNRSNVEFYSNVDSNPVVQEHGLNIARNIQIIVEHDYVCKITVISSGAKFSTNIDSYLVTGTGYPYVKSVGSELQKCKLSWTSDDLNKQVWMFGDSYFGNTNPARWMYWLKESGYDANILINSYAGEASNTALADLKNLLKFGAPKFAVWCMGMNDGGDGSSPSAAWAQAINGFLSTCETRGIVPVLSTIPSVPTLNHEAKNEWVRESGYRYIDFAAAVGASADGTWYGGMLSTDGIHPTQEGALALYARALVDVPEIMIK